MFCNGGSLPALFNCTFTANTATNWGGAISCYNYSSPTLENCILWDNQANAGSEISGPAVVTYSDVKGGWSGTGNIDADPLFVDPANADFRLMNINTGHGANSPCIDAGDPNTIPTGSTSVDGNPDVGIVDMGYHHPEIIRLAVDPMSSGGTATFHVDDCSPKSWFYLCWSLTGAGPTMVSGVGLSLSLQLSPPIGSIDPFRLSSSGTKQFGPVPVPQHIMPGTQVWFQGVSLDIGGGGGLVVTNMVPITVQ